MLAARRGIVFGTHLQSDAVRGIVLTVMRVRPLVSRFVGQQEMKSLLILRHAEAVALSGAVDDYSRPLSTAGQEQAIELGKHLDRLGVTSDAIACSTALRARQTAELIVKAAQWTAETNAYDAFYNASIDDLLTHVKSRAEDIEQLCIVAHAPGVPELVSFLVTDEGDLNLVYAAGTLAEILLDVDQWSEVRGACGALRSLRGP